MAKGIKEENKKWAEKQNSPVTPKKKYTPSEPDKFVILQREWVDGLGNKNETMCDYVNRKLKEDD